MTEANVFLLLSLIIIVATVCAIIAKALRQPLIPAYILAGILLGPVFKVITDSELIFTLSEIGVAFLLFIVGLEIDIKKLRDVGMVSSFGGIIQMVATATLAFILAALVGFGALEATYIGIMMALSSTMVAVKLLSDKKKIDTLHGRIAIGILVMQDIAAILVLALFSDYSGVSAIIGAIAKTGAFFLVAAILSKFILPGFFKFAAKARELLFLCAISLCLLFATTAAFFNLSIAIGAFIAGIAIANLPYHIEIMARVKPLRDFFATIFFVALGLRLQLEALGSIIYPLIIFLAFVLLVKPFIIQFICSFFGYQKRTGYEVAIILAQVSEFSLIIASLALTAGILTLDGFTLVLMVGIITITATTYYSKFDEAIYHRLFTKQGFLDRLTDREKDMGFMPPEECYDAILCGYNRIGYGIEKNLVFAKKKLLILDFNPEVIKHLIRVGKPCLYGDVGDPEVLERINLRRANMIISTVPSKADNLAVIEHASEFNEKMLIFVTANTVDDALEMYDRGADYVILPHFLGGEYVSVMIRQMKKNAANIIKAKLAHIAELKHRRTLGHELSMHQ